MDNKERLIKGAKILGLTTWTLVAIGTTVAVWNAGLGIFATIIAGANLAGVLYHVVKDAKSIK